jgi:hypothetical protein
MIGGPQIVVPSMYMCLLNTPILSIHTEALHLHSQVGQNKYDSAISHQTEYAPIMTSLVGPKGKPVSIFLLDCEAKTYVQAAICLYSVLLRRP